VISELMLYMGLRDCATKTHEFRQNMMFLSIQLRIP
jgi:hypothetical protein